MPASPATAARIERETAKLLRYFQPITHCHVVVVAPHRHHRFGRAYALHLEVGVPGGPLIVNHEPAPLGHPAAAPPAGKPPAPEARHRDITVAIREAFDVAGFTRKVKRLKPRTLAFTSKTAASLWLGQRTGRILTGLQSLDGDGPGVFVLPSPSGLATSYWSLDPWRALARHLTPAPSPPRRL
jgi:hypothetical protein